MSTTLGISSLKNRFLNIIRFTALLLIVAFFLNFSALIISFLYGSTTPQILGADDPTYLRLAWNYEQIDRSYREVLYGNAQPTTTSLLEKVGSRSNAITDIIIGRIARAVLTNPIHLGIWLDILCSLFSFFAFLKFIRGISSNVLNAYACSIIAIAMPYLLIPGSPRSLFDIFDPTFSYTYQDYDPPVYRAVYTQISFCLYCATLLLANSLLKSQTISNLRAFACGLLSGIQIYVYFFGYVAATAVAASFFVFQLFQGVNRSQFKAVTRRLIIFCLGLLFSSAPGLAILLSGKEGGSSDAKEIRDFFYLPGHWIAISISATILALVVKHSRFRIILFILAVCSTLELLLPNIQPLIGQAIAPYHFARFYLHPLFSSFFALLIFELLKRYSMHKLCVALAASLVIMGGLVSTSISIRQAQRNDLSNRDFMEFVEFANQALPKQATIAVMPVVKPFQKKSDEKFGISYLPSFIFLYLQRPLIYQHWEFDGKITDDDLIREITLGELFSGYPQRLIACDLDVALPGDLFYLTWTSYKLQRRAACSRLSFWEEKMRLHRDEVITPVIDYVVEAKEHYIIPQEIKDKWTLLWGGRNGYIQIYSVRKGSESPPV